jgi:hypothetical protein
MVINMNMNFSKFSAPVLGDGAQELYAQLYGDAGDRFIDILNTSPNEIAVISRLIAYLKEKKGAE